MSTLVDDAALDAALPDELLLLALLRLPELNAWAACASVNRRWMKLITANRTRLRIVLMDDSALPLESALLAMDRSSQPLVELSVQAKEGMALPRSVLEPSPCSTHLTQLTQAAAESLEAFELSGAPFTHPNGARQHRDSEGVLDPALYALARVACSRLRSIDLSWLGSAVSSGAAEALLERFARGVGETNVTCDGAAPSACLHGLHLGGCLWVDSRVSDKLILPIAPRLTALSLAGCANLGCAAAAMLCAACPSLTELDLSALRLTPMTLRMCLGHAQLRRGLRALSLAAYTGLPSTSFAEALSACERLTSIDFSASLIADEAILEVAWRTPAHLAGLKSVRLAECSAITDRAISELVRAAGGSVASVIVGGPFTPLSRGSATAIGQFCRAPLTRLDLQCCRLPAAALAALAPIGASLSHLDLSGALELTEEGLSRLLARSGPGCGARLRVLLLRCCDHAVTDSVLAGFLPRAHALQHLDVSYCYRLTDVSGVLIANGRRRALQALHHLDITGCFRLSSRAKAHLQRPVTSAPPLRLVGLDDGHDDGGGSCGVPSEREHMAVRSAPEMSCLVDSLARAELYSSM